MKRTFKYLCFLILGIVMSSAICMLCHRELYIINYLFGILYAVIAIKLNSWFEPTFDIFVKAFVISTVIMTIFTLVGHIEVYYFESAIILKCQEYIVSACDNEISFDSMYMTIILILFAIILNDCTNYYILKTKSRPTYTILFGKYTIRFPERKGSKKNNNN